MRCLRTCFYSGRAASLYGLLVTRFKSHRESLCIASAACGRTIGVSDTSAPTTTCRSVTPSSAAILRQADDRAIFSRHTRLPPIGRDLSDRDALRCAEELTGWIGRQPRSQRRQVTLVAQAVRQEMKRKPRLHTFGWRRPEWSALYPSARASDAIAQAFIGAASQLRPVGGGRRKLTCTRRS
jgi:hypothetical protein